MKKVISIILITSIACTFFGCSAKETDNSGNGSAVSSAIEETGATSADIETTEAAPQLTKLSYTIDYHRISPFLKDRYDEKQIELAHKVIDAFLNNESSIETPAMRRYEQEELHGLVRYMCPPFVAFCDVEYKLPVGSGDTTTVFSWRYRVSKEQMDKELAEFDDVIASYMDNVYEEDNEAMRAFCIYYAYSKEISYDYDTVYDDSDDTAYKMSPFCALVHHTGVCYNIAEGLMFLFTLADINAGTVGSYEGSGAHEWTIAEIDGKYYYFDATWDANDGEWDSLKYFGMTEEDRASEWGGSYPADSVKFNCSEEIHGKFDLSDKRFEAIHGDKVFLVKKIVFDHELQRVYIITGSDTIDFDMKKPA